MRREGYAPGMTAYDELLTTVRTRTAIRDPEEARTAISAVASSLAACMTDAERDRLAADAGTPVTDSADEPPLVSLTVDEFVEEVAHRTGWAPTRARYAARAVLSALAENDPQLRDAVTRRLPEAAELFAAPGPATDAGPTG